MAATQKSFLESISPWPSRSNTPKPEPDKTDGKTAPAPLEKSKGDDHTITAHHRLSRKDYPPDCPKSNIKWFYAVDVGRSLNAPATLALTEPLGPKAKATPSRSASEGCPTPSSSKEIHRLLC